MNSFFQVEDELIKEKGLAKESTEKLGQFVRLRGGLLTHFRTLNLGIIALSSEFNQSMGNIELLDKLMQFEELAKNARFKKGVEELKVSGLDHICLWLLCLVQHYA